MLPTPSSSRRWWSRSSVLSKSSNRLSSSKKFTTIATAIGLKPKKTPTPIAIEEPTSPVLPLHTGDIESSPRSANSVVKPVSVAVGWADPQTVQPEEFLEAYPQSVFSTDLDPFAAAAKYPHRPPNVSDPLRFSTFSEASTLESPVRKGAPHAHNRTSLTSSSTLSHQRSDITTTDSSPISSPLLSPVTSGRHLSRSTVESERILMRENSFSPSPVSPQSPRDGWDDRFCIAASPSSATLTDAHGNSSATARSRILSRGLIDLGRPKTGHLVSDHQVSPVSPSNISPRVVIRQPSSKKLQPLLPQTAPPTSELPPAPDDVREHDISLLPAFVEHTSQSATSSSSSLSFASSLSLGLDTSEAEVRRRDIRRLKDAKKPGKSRPPSPSTSTDATLDAHGLTSKSFNCCREFSPTRSLKKAISIQNIPKRPVGNNTPPSLPSAEDTKAVKKQRSFHHTRIPMPPFPVSLKQASSSNSISISGRDVLSVPEECRPSPQASQKSPLGSPVLSPTSVRKRLFSGTSLRRSTSSQTPEPDDDTPSIFSLPSTISTLTRPHTAIPIRQSSVSNKPELSSFWDDEIPGNPGAGSESRDLGPQQILSPAEILKFENMVRDGGNLNGFVREHDNPITPPATSRHSARTAHEQTTSVRLSSPPSATRKFNTLGTASGRFLTQDRQRIHSNSQQGKGGDVTNGRPQTAISSLGGQSVRSMSIQSLNTLHGLPPPPRLRSRPLTSSGPSPGIIDNVPSLPPGDRSSVVALAPLSPPPVRSSATRRVLDPPSVAPSLRPGISRTPSFLDMRDDMDRELPPPPEDSFLDMGKVSLDTVRSSMEEDRILS